ncbi:hypothetical protein Tco_1296338, partial [Tanacetum coccineum]
MERGTSPSTGQFSWSFNDSKLFSGPSRNAECAKCKLLIGNLQVLEATLEMYMHLEKHIIDSTALILWSRCGLDDWVEMLVLYCWRSADEDVKVVGVINKLYEEVATTNKETGYFIQELDVVPGWVVATQKTSEFLKETQEKDDERLRQLEVLVRKTEARARDASIKLCPTPCILYRVDGGDFVENC